MSWSSIESVLFDIGKLVFLVYFMLFLIAVFSEKKVSSAVIGLMVLAVANGMMTALTPVLYELSSRSGIGYKFVWYGSFTLIDCIAVFLLYKFHALLRQSVGRIASLIGQVFLLLASLQSIRFIDRFVIGYDVLQPFYQYLVPLINVLLIPAIIMLWLADIRIRRAVAQEGA
ncbi:hypothetical protein QE250_12555 [Chromatiaceae bacterium AAb-1]|nr:hypothetical protein [Chromatiaceae bacterium AAb-1]